MVSIRLVVPNTDTLVTLGDFSDYHIWLALVGLVLTGSMLYHQVKGGVLAGIVLITLVVWVVDQDGPAHIAEIPHLQYGVTRNIDLRPSALTADMLPPLLAFLFVGLFDISGVMFGLSSLAKIMEEDGHIPGSIWAFLGSSIGTMVAAMAGCSPIIIHVESAAGIREGGKTGLTAVVVGLLFFLSLFFAPLFGKVPTAATAPILILVGAMMIGESQHIDWADMSQAIPAFLTCMMMPFTFSIPNGILFGVGMSLTFFVTTGEFLEYVPWLVNRSKKMEEEEAAEEARRLQTIDERTYLQPPPIVSPSKLNHAGHAHHTLFDEQPMTRRFSLILPKDEADDQCARDMELSSSLTHATHPHGHSLLQQYHNHQRGRSGSGSGNSTSGSGGGEGGGAFAMQI
jgi:MFS superfamily sulfate permease-like transporter